MPTPNDQHYDVVIAGAHCAGAATALLLARWGLRPVVARAGTLPFGRQPSTCHTPTRPSRSGPGPVSTRCTRRAILAAIPRRRRPAPCLGQGSARTGGHHEGEDAGHERDHMSVAEQEPDGQPPERGGSGEGKRRRAKRDTRTRLRHAEPRRRGGASGKSRRNATSAEAPPDLMSEESFRADAAAFKACTHRLQHDGTDLAGVALGVLTRNTIGAIAWTLMRTDIGDTVSMRTEAPQ